MKKNSLDRFIIRTERNGLTQNSSTVSLKVQICESSKSESLSSNTNGTPLHDVINEPSTSTSKHEPTTPHPDDPIQEIPKNRFERSDRLVRGPYQPKLNKYPSTKVGNKLRSFQPQWYTKYDWIEYSPSADAVFCLYCRFFSSNDSGKKGHTDKAFITTGFKSWNKANECFKAHQGSTCHNQSLKSFSSFTSNKETPINVLLDKQKEEVLAKKQVEKNNQSVMERLIDIVICLAKSGYPFRGHRENESNVNKGLFLSLVDILRKYDPVMKRHLEESPRNAMYTSNHIQNDLIKALHNVIL